MGVRVDWYDTNEDILYYVFSDPWTWEIYHAALLQGRAMMSEKDHYIGILNDLRASHKMPTNIINKTSSYIDTRPANTGLVIYVSDGFFLKSVYRILSAVKHEVAEQYVLALTLSEAQTRMRAWLDEHRL